MDQKKLQELISKLKSSNLKIKKNAIETLAEAAKSGKDIEPAVDSLEKVLKYKNKEIWECAAETLTYYYQHFVSFYCRNYGIFPEKIKMLKSSNKKERLSTASFLRSYTLMSKGRIWKYTDQEKMHKLTDELESINSELRKKSAETLSKMAKNNFEISHAIPVLTTHLTDEDIDVKWACAETLGYYIGNYMDFDYSYSNNYLRSPNVKDKISYAKRLEASAMYDIVSDRDERDISFALPALAVLLSDKNAEVRKSVINAIKTAQGEHTLSIIVPSIIETLLDKDRKLIHPIAASILKKEIEMGFDLTEYIPAFINLLSEEWGKEFRKEIILVLRRAVIKGYDLIEHIPFFKELLSDEDEEVKFGAADTLAYYYALKKNWDDIKKLFTHSDKDIRQEVAGTLEQLKSNIDISPIFDNLKELLSDKDQEVNFVSARTLMAKFKTSNDLAAAIPILVKFTSDKDPKIKKNAYYVITRWMIDNITCSSKLNKSKWDILKPIIIVLENTFNAKGYKFKKSIAESLTQYYTHTNQWEKIRELLKKSTNPIKHDIMFRLTSCGWSDCKVDISPLIPDLLDLYLKSKNKDVRKYALRKLENGLNASSARELLKRFEEADINKRWDLIDKLRKVAMRREINNIEKKLHGLDEDRQFKSILELLNNESGIIREWATDNLWNFVYKDYNYFEPAIPLLINNLTDDDVFVRKITASVLSGTAPEKYNISKGIPALAMLLSDKSEKVRHIAASALSNTVGAGWDITEAISELMKNINSKNKDVSYFSSLAPRKYVKDAKTALFVLQELNDKNVKRNKEVKRLIEKCNEYINTV